MTAVTVTCHICGIGRHLGRAAFARGDLRIHHFRLDLGTLITLGIAPTCMFGAETRQQARENLVNDAVF